MEIKNMFLNDGRKAEQRTYVDESGNKITELWTEAEVPLKLAEKVIEKKAEVIVERIIDKVDLSTGEVLERKVEAIEPNVKLELREHIGLTKDVIPVAEQSASLTKEEVASMIAQAMNSNKMVAMSAPPKKFKTLVGDRVAESKKSTNIADMVLLALIIAGVVFVAYQAIM